jgi:hypothetical protein
MSELDVLQSRHEIPRECGAAHQFSPELATRQRHQPGTGQIVHPHNVFERQCHDDSRLLHMNAQLAQEFVTA